MPRPRSEQSPRRSNACRRLGIRALALPLALCAGTLVRAARAQQPTDTMGLRGAATSFGVESLRPLGGDGGLPMGVLRWTTLKPDAAGFEIAMNVASGEGYALFMPEAGAAWNVPAGRGALLVRGGVTGLMIFIPGLYLGMSTLIPIDHNVGLRLDVTYRALMWNGGSMRLVSVGGAVSLLEPPAECRCR